MNVTWMLGGPHRSRAYVDARAATIAVGLGELPPNQIRFPTVSITYQFEQYTTVMKVGTEMKAKNLLPRIYLWDTDKPEPEVAVWFGVKTPDQAFLQKLGLVYPGSSSALIAQAMSCEEMFTVAEANTIKRQAREFIEEFANLGFAMVMVSEEGADVPPLVQPQLQFMVKTITRRAPTFDD